VNVKSHWLQEIRKHRPDAPIVLCGCMASLRCEAQLILLFHSSGQVTVDLYW
jgi:hypothetical protein